MFFRNRSRWAWSSPLNTGKWAEEGLPVRGRSLVHCIFLLALAASSVAQNLRGELRIEAHDPQGAALSAAGEIVSDANHFRRNFGSSPDGRYTAKDLPFGMYRVTLTAAGFAPATDLIEIRSEVPIRMSVTLGVAPVQTHVDVSDSATLVDPDTTGTQYAIGQQTLTENIAAQPGRSLTDLVNELPGWLYEANGILHPRGSEYDVQYVVDGQPLTQNRSPAFAPAFDASEVSSMRVLTADYPAEYGRKLGGVIEVTTGKDMPLGWHGQLVAGGGSFSTATGALNVSWAKARDRFMVSADGLRTDRYLDPPVLENYANTGDGTGFSFSEEHDFSDHDRLRITLSHNVSHFLIPNELVQQQAGQRQDAANTETNGQVVFQHSISSNLLLSFSGSVRDATAKLASNDLATPIIVSQDRGYREGYVRGDLAGHHGHHDWKIGVDGVFNPVTEHLAYTITDPSQFDPGTALQFQFADHRWDLESSAYAQDQVHLGNWNLSAGLRFDSYNFVVHQSAWSPRIGVSRFVSSLNLLIHASYDRVFQTPATENLLVASSSQVQSLNPVVVRLPVEPAHANFYEVGVTKALFQKLRLDANVFRRDFHNYADDDVLLDSGVSFPTAFAKAAIYGEEARLEVPRWGRFSGYISYANQVGTGRGPITGGLFLGSDADARTLADRSTFAVSQDQRNTARMQIRFQAPRKIWFAAAANYGSGLPADTGGGSPVSFLPFYGPEILNQVNFAQGRVRPNYSVDLGAGAELYRKEHRSATFQIQAANLTNRVNVINFASLFSGTAVAPPRSVSAQLRLTF